MQSLCTHMAYTPGWWRGWRLKARQTLQVLRYILMNLHDIDVIALIISHSRLVFSPLPYTIHNESELQVPRTHANRLQAVCVAACATLCSSRLGTMCLKLVTRSSFIRRAVQAYAAVWHHHKSAHSEGATVFMTYHTISLHNSPRQRLSGSPRSVEKLHSEIRC